MPTGTSLDAGAIAVPAFTTKPFTRSLRCSDFTRGAYFVMSAAGSAPRVRVQHVDLEGDARGIRRACQGVEESALGRRHELAPWQ